MSGTLLPGDHAPWFRARALSGSATYQFDLAAGRHILVLLFGSAQYDPTARALALVERHRLMFDDEQASFFGVCVDPQDVEQSRIRQQIPGIRFFLDYDLAVSQLYGASRDGEYRTQWILLDPALRVLARFDLEAGEQAIAYLGERVGKREPDGFAPVLLVPDLFEPAFCRALIQGYEANGGQQSGFMRDVDGRTVAMIDPRMKQRRDWMIDREDVRRAISGRLSRRLNPALKRAFQFEATRIERHLVACYEAGAGHFRPHRDNTTSGTAHRKFAVTINLNANDYAGGDLCFPEFGPRTYRAPTGGAIVFSCSLLHEARPVTEGRRYACLPFLYDEEGARIREANNAFLGDGVTAYRRGEAAG